MIKIKVSYEKHEELLWLLSKLRPEIKKCRESKNREGRFLKAYIDLKE